MSLSPVALAARRVFAAASGHEPRDKTWKMLTFFVALPAVGIAWLNAFLHEEGHHQPEFVAFNHLRLRTKKFPWGDGNHSLFHNPHTNALPDGYEESHD